MTEAGGERQHLVRGAAEGEGFGLAAPVRRHDHQRDVVAARVAHDLLGGGADLHRDVGLDADLREPVGDRRRYAADSACSRRQSRSRETVSDGSGGVSRTCSSSRPSARAPTRPAACHTAVSAAGDPSSGTSR
jgi:hypothetical protein